MPSKIIIGCEPWLSLAEEDWKRVDPSLSLNLINIKLDNSYSFDLAELDYISNKNMTAFVAWGPEFLNFQRWELMGELKIRGFKMPPLIHPSAIVSNSAKIYENVWIQALSLVGPNVTIGVNSIIEIGGRIGAHCDISKCVWISRDSNISAFVKVGSHTILGPNLGIAQGVKIGKQCYIESTLNISADCPDKSFSLLSSNLVGRIFN